jgi:hypothetical protein
VHSMLAAGALMSEAGHGRTTLRTGSIQGNATGNKPSKVQCIKSCHVGPSHHARHARHPNLQPPPRLLRRRWAYFSNTLVYACQRPDRPEQCVTFWQTSSGEKYTKFIKRLAAVEAAGDHCVLAAAGELAGEYLLILCNAIGSPVESR